MEGAAAKDRLGYLSNSNGLQLLSHYSPIKPFFASSMVNRLVIFSNSLSCRKKKKKDLCYTDINQQSHLYVFTNVVIVLLTIPALAPPASLSNLK